MFNFKPFFQHHEHKPKFDAAKPTGMDLEGMHEEMMHNMCELNEKNEVTWNAGLNL